MPLLTAIRERHAGLLPRHVWKEETKDLAHVDWEYMKGIWIRLPTQNTLSEELVCADFERADRAFVHAFLRPGDTFVDIGAHIGLYSLIASSRVGMHGRVISFEPCAKTYSRLEENMMINGKGNMTCVREALGNATGKATLHTETSGFDLANSLSGPTLGIMYVEEEIDIDTWDAFADHHGIGSVTLMKIDVEGWEHHVCAGAEHLLKRPDAPVLLMEFTDGFGRFTGVKRGALYRQLQDWGYSIFTASASGLSLIPHDVREHYECMNVIAAKNPETVRRRLLGARMTAIVRRALGR